MDKPSTMRTALCACLVIFSFSQSSRGQSQSNQKDRSDCGLHCLFASITALRPGSTRLSSLADQLGPPEAGGYSLLQLKEVAERQGLKTLGVSTSTSALRRRPDRFVCIAAVDGNHFVVVTNVQRGIVSLIDGGKRIETEEAVFSKRWSGDALLLSQDVLTPEAKIPFEWPWLRILLGGGAIITAAGIAITLVKKFNRMR